MIINNDNTTSENCDEEIIFPKDKELRNYLFQIVSSASSLNLNSLCSSLSFSLINCCFICLCSFVKGSTKITFEVSFKETFS